MLLGIHGGGGYAINQVDRYMPRGRTEDFAAPRGLSRRRLPAEAERGKHGYSVLGESVVRRDLCTPTL